MTTDPDLSEPERRRVGEGLISGTAWTVIHVLVSVPIAFAVNVLVARSLGAVDYGRLALLTMVLTLATAAASMGVGSALMQFVTKASESGRHGEVHRLISGAQGYNVLVAAPVVALVVALVVDVPLPLLIVAIAFGIFAPAALQVGPIMLASQHRSDRAAKIAMVSNLVTQMTVVIAALINPTAAAVWAARIAAAGALMVLPFLALSSSLRRSAMRPALPWSLPRAFWVFAVPTGLATMVSQLVTDRVQVFFLEWLGDPVAVGVFALAFGLAIQILAPVQAAVGPLLPAFAALRERGIDEARFGLLRVTKVSAVTTGAVVSVGVPALAGLIPWIYGTEFARSSDYFVLITGAAAVVVVGSGAFASLMARLKGGTYLYVNLIALVVMVTVAIAAIPPLGAWGAVASMVGGTVTRALLLVGIEARHYRITVREVVTAFAPVVLALGTTTTVWFTVVGRLAASEWLSAAGGGLLSGVLFVVLLRITGAGLVPRDRDALLAALPSGVRSVAAVGVTLVSRSPSRSSRSY